MNSICDTNILLRFLLKSSPDYITVRQAISHLKARRERIFTTPQNIAEFWNVCTRPTTARGGLGLTVEATQRRLISTGSLFTSQTGASISANARTAI